MTNMEKPDDKAHTLSKKSFYKQSRAFIASLDDWGRLLLLVLAISLVYVAATAAQRAVTSDKPNPRYAFLREKTIILTRKLDLVAARDMQGVKAPTSGIFVPLRQNGEKLAKDEIYAVIVPATMADKVSAYKEQKESLERQTSNQAKTFLQNAEYLTALQKLRFAIFQKNSQNFRDSLQQIKFTQENASYTDHVQAQQIREALAAKAEELVQADKAVVLKSQKPCWVFFQVSDAYLVKNDEQKVTLQALKAMQDKNPEISDFTFAAAKKGDLVASEVYSRSFTLYAPLPAGTNLPLELNGYRLSLDRGQSFNEEVRVKTEYFGKAGYYAISISEDSINFDTDNRFPGALLQSIGDRGIVVSRSSLFNYDSHSKQALIYLVKNGKTVPYLVKIEQESESEVLIADLDKVSDKQIVEGTLYAANPWTCYDGMLIE